MRAIQRRRFVKLGDAKRLTQGGGDHGIDFQWQPMDDAG
jgi:hypothetical protein